MKLSRPHLKYINLRALVIIGLVVGIGLLTLTLSRAATTFISLEPENASLSDGAVIVTSPDASGGKAIQFAQEATMAKWWSGQSESVTTKDGSFAAWRDRPVEIGGTWALSDSPEHAINSPSWSIAEGAPYGSIPRMDYAFGAMIKHSTETWGDAAIGAYDARWTAQLKAMKVAWGAREPSNMFIRFAHEFNGNWYPWSVNNDDINNFKLSWRRFYSLVQVNFPGANVVWCPNAGSSWDYDIRTLWPGDDYVDVVSVDQYNTYPHADTVEAFNKKINSYSAQGGPTGMESFRKFAEAHGKPMAVSEWANGGVAGPGGGGESPAMMVALNTWLKAHGSQTPSSGKVLYEVLFNVPGYEYHYSLYPEDAESGNVTTAAKYRELW